MGNPRTVLWIALAAILYLNFTTWMEDYGSPFAAAAPVAASSQLNNVAKLAESLPDVAAATAPTVPTAVAPGSVAAIATTVPTAAAPAEAGVVHVTTDVLDVDVSLRGGELVRAELPLYPLHKDTPNIPVQLFANKNEATLFLLQSGLASGDGQPEPNHLAAWTAPAAQMTMAAGAAELRVPFSWTDGQGLTVVKTFVFKRGSYAVDLLYDVQNHSATPHKLAPYAQILRHWEPPTRSYFDVETYAFKGPAIWDGKKYRKLDVEKDADKTFSMPVTDGWIAALQHHFVAAIVPIAGQANVFDLKVQDKDFLLRTTGPAAEVAAGSAAQLSQKLFFGPKLQAQIEATGPQLERAADYGMLTVIARPLFTALKWVHRVVGNWGWSIIIVTALIKLMFYPLSQASGRSMAKMRSVAPRMKQIQEQHKDDREKLGRAMMELYKREKINPLAGCLPMVVQIPVFIAFYWVLLESVEMRQAPFMLWINDLSTKDPVFVLPLLMGAAMYGQFKLNPAPPDPMQAKVMQFMPLVMTGMMAWFPSGLVLYWLTNTVLSIAQQYRVNQVVEAEAKKLRH
jgi:YidC/Oxa1 family membrane protein insertase